MNDKTKKANTQRSSRLSRRTGAASTMPKMLGAAKFLSVAPLRLIPKKCAGYARTALTESLKLKLLALLVFPVIGSHSAHAQFLGGEGRGDFAYTEAELFIPATQAVAVPVNHPLLLLMLVFLTIGLAGLRLRRRRQPS